MKKGGGSEEGVIGVHALCIISYSAGAGATSRNESGQRCTGANAANANERAEFRWRLHLIKSTSHGEHSAAVLSAGKKHRESEGGSVEKEMSFLGVISGSAGDKRSDYG